MQVRIKIIRSQGNYIEGDLFEIDEQVAHQLVAAGIAKLEKVTTHQTSADLTQAAPAPAKKTRKAK